MQDQIIKKTTSVPVLSQIPFLGSAFSYQDDEIVKTELLVFLRPTVVENADLDGELKEFKRYLPDQEKLQPQSQTSSEES